MFVPRAPPRITGSIRSFQYAVRSIPTRRAPFTPLTSRCWLSVKPVSAVPRPNASKPIPTTAPSRVPLSPSRTKDQIPPRRLKQIYNANRLLESGHVRLYKSPANLPYLLGSYAICTACIGGALWLMYLGHWRQSLDPKKGSDENLVPWIVPITHRFMMFAFVMLGYWLVFRTGRRINTVDLIPGSPNPKLLVTMRKSVPVPFTKPRQITAEVSDFVLPSIVTDMPEVPSWADLQAAETKAGIGKRFSMAFYNFFAGTRKIFTNQGFINVSVNDERGLKIDITGEYDDHGRSLISIATVSD